MDITIKGIGIVSPQPLPDNAFIELEIFENVNRRILCSCQVLYSLRQDDHFFRSGLIFLSMNEEDLAYLITRYPPPFDFLA